MARAKRALPTWTKQAPTKTVKKTTTTYSGPKPLNNFTGTNLKPSLKTGTTSGGWSVTDVLRPKTKKTKKR